MMVDSDESIYLSNEMRKRMRLSFLITPQYWSNTPPPFKIVPDPLLDACAVLELRYILERPILTISELRLYKSEGRTSGGSLLKLYFPSVTKFRDN